MTRKDYILIAEALRQAANALNGYDRYERIPLTEESKVQIANESGRTVTRFLADALSQDNPRFDREHFLAVVRGEKELNSRPSSKNTEPESLYGKRCARCGAHFYRNGACECLR